MSIGAFTTLVKGGAAPQQASDQRTARGTIVRAPASASDALYIVTPGFSMAFPYEVAPGHWLAGATLPSVGTECLVIFDEHGDAWVPLWDGALTSASFVRAFGPDTSTAIAANAWTAIVLDPAGEPWRQFGTASWEWILPGDPDYALSPAGIRCLRDGVYDFAGAVVFSSTQRTGDRGVRVIEVKGPYAGQWQLTQAMTMPNTVVAPIIVAGEAAQYAGNIVELQAWSSVATSTTSNPQSEWLSAVRLGA
jgi:hypothetical protein